MASTETRARLRIKKALEENGHYVVTLHGDATSGRGRSDLVVCAGGLFFWLEVKTLDGSPSPAQLRRIREVRQTGGTACIITNIHEARWVIETRQKGYVPYMADEPGVKVLDLSSFRRVEVPPDPDAIPFPDPTPDLTALQPGEVKLEVTITAPSVPDHIVEGTGEIKDDPQAGVADDELNSMLAQVSHRIAEQQAAAPLLPPPPAAIAPEEKPRRGGRPKKEKSAQEEPPRQIAAAPPWNTETPLPTVTGTEPEEAATLQAIHDTLLQLWDKVTAIETTLAAELDLLEKAIAGGGAT